MVSRATFGVCVCVCRGGGRGIKSVCKVAAALQRGIPFDSNHPSLALFIGVGRGGGEGQAPPQ